MANRVRIALIGLGEAARNIHLPACARAKEVQLVAGADPDPAARRRFEAALPAARVFEDAAQMLDAVRPEWVIVATPPESHRDLCLLALARGAHVFCEKPFVPTAEDADAVLAEAQARGKNVVVNHEFPRMEIFAEAFALAGSARFGAIRFLQFWQHLFEAPGEATGWRAQHLTLREFGTHALDLAVRLYGTFPERVYARMGHPDGDRSSDLLDVVTLDFPGALLASIVLDRACHGPHRYLEMRMDGEHASYRASFGGRAAIELGLDPRARRPRLQLNVAAGGQAWLERAEHREVVARNSLTPFADATARHLDDAVLAVKAGRRPAVDGVYAQNIVRLVDTAYHSARSGRAEAFQSGGVLA